LASGDYQIDPRVAKGGGDIGQRRVAPTIAVSRAIAIDITMMHHNRFGGRDFWQGRGRTGHGLSKTAKKIANRGITRPLFLFFAC
jgi:hypothetical protein